MNSVMKVVILGSTGSIGKQALDVIDRNPQAFKVVGLAAQEVDQLAAQAEKYKPLAIAVGDEERYSELKERTGRQSRVLAGVSGLSELAALPEADTVLVAVSGAVGILPTLAAVQAGKRVALANKETLVAAGDLVMEMVKEKGVLLIPVDSEHSAVFQCLAGETDNLEKVWLTASGGPFREYSREQLEHVTVDMALRHPNWAMGPKITVDSATMMNKGLEVIEAHHLFAVDYKRIQVLIQKESIIHSMVELRDGAFLAHMGVPDMRIPIQYALTYPERWISPAKCLDFTQLQAIHFDRPDLERFPCLGLAYQAGSMGGTMPAVLNAANETAVEAFLQGRIPFTRIAVLVEQVMSRHQVITHPNLETILDADAMARQTCSSLIVTGGRI
ncbi:MAG TPA: 1-deoxy-D-xylulose-5-phosphate reductoisomerase [Syntrophomonadaceae bacterium]|nr:1-deoxy-D-xylulose-5-phosphate reductoisomerase [Syntrophomonadaceae bacterium]